MYVLKGRLFSTQINTAPSDQSILLKNTLSCWKIIVAQVTRVSTVFKQSPTTFGFSFQSGEAKGFALK